MRQGPNGRPVKYIFVTGGVVSSLGKGLAAASIGRLLEDHGYTVALQKFDPYINVDPGTMSPYQHGEVYVTDDGAETDLDLGHYERFTSMVATRNSNWTTGKIYLSVIQKERRGDYLGRTVQVIPAHHQRDQGRDPRRRKDVDIVLVEIGGTVGDIESMPFLEAIRQFRLDVGRDNAIYIHLTLVPFIGTAGELKTKPTQHSVRDLRSIGIQPDILLCRTDRFLDADIKRKIALFCDVDEEAVITAKDVSTIYEVPLVLSAEGLDRIVLKLLGLPLTEARTEAWQELVDRIKNPIDELTIHVVGKYTGYEDSYKSLNEAVLPRRLRPSAEGAAELGRGRGARKGKRRGAARRRARHPRARRLRLARHARHDEGRRVRARARRAVLRHLLRLPVGDRRIRAQRLRPRGRRLHRSRRERAAQGDLQAARPARRRRPRRHDASRPLRLRAGARARSPSGSTARRSSHERHRHRFEFNCLYEPSLTEQGHARVRPIAGRQVRRDRGAAVASRGSSPCSSIRSFSRSRSGRIRCSRASSRRRTGTRPGQAGRPGPARRPVAGERPVDADCVQP